MQTKLKFTLLLLLTAVVIFSCTKHNNDQPVTPVLPPQFDTLGAGWQRIQVDSGRDFEDVFFLNNQTGFLCGNQYLGKSTDGGLTWKNLLPDSVKDKFINLFFTDINNGWAFGPATYFLRTKDGGASRQKINGTNVFDGQFFDANNGYLSIPGALYKTSDGGITQNRIQVPASAPGSNGLFFFNQGNGWFAGNFLYKTQDSAKTFSASSGTMGQGEYVIQFTDSLHGWVAGSTAVYRTVDAGKTLQTLLINTDVKGGDVQFFDNNNGFILGNGRIYSTADGGTTLNKLCTIHKSQLYEIHFTDMNHGWATGNGGFVYRYVRP